MKKEISTCPHCFEGQEMYGFDWKEHVLAIPSPLVVVTTYKKNGKTNATMQSWITFANDNGFYCILGDVNKKKHMYASIKERSVCVINFPSIENYKKCYSTIENNGDDIDEIETSGLTAEKSSLVDAPRIGECFLNLECEYVWEKELCPNTNTVVMCLKVVNVVMDEEYFDEEIKGRYGESGYLYNVHSPVNPITGKEEETCVAILKKYKTYDEL